MSLEGILSAITAEAADEAAGIVADAERRAAEIRAEARAEAAAEEERLSRSTENAAETATRRITSRAHLDAARSRQGAREAVYLEARERAAAKLRRFRAEEGYTELLRRLIEEGLAVLPDATEVHVRGDDLQSARDLLASLQSGAETVGADVPWGGAVLTAEGRTVRNDLESRFEKADHHLRFIAGDLFPALRGGRS